MLPARFHLPGLRYNYPLNMFWVSLLEEHPEYFREGVEIGSFFGVFPMALWNGGRLTPAYDQCDKAFVEGVIKAVNDKGIPVRYTFTNPLLNEHDCEDPYCNYLMQAADNGMNEVMIFSPILEKYLREKYPNFAYNSSTCKEIKDVDEINREMERDYKYVVLDYNFNNKWDILDKIERKDKLEVLVNTLCEPGCKRRGEHYRQIAKDQKTMLLNRTLPADKQIPIKHWHCDYGEYNCVHTIQDYPTFISPEDIWEKYIPAGINNFKIEGRTGNLFSLIDTYCFFMLKPEKAGEARLLLLRNLEKAHVITVSRPRPGQWP
ncbi:MAG: hypothetical protein IK018_11800 [Lachnospiraceae bacterium]|nr:hypothetical protein [Lachnospiraceae bacterium]MBR5994479.1 hypothetical protein [Lachnospiraceae bacterium]